MIRTQTRQRKMRVIPHMKSKMKKYPKNMVDIIMSALDYMTDGIIIGDFDGKVYYHNKAWLRIHALDENLDLRGKNSRDYERPELLPIYDSLVESIQKRGTFSHQLSTVRRDGVYHDVHISANVIRDIDPPLAVVVLREVTDLVQVQKEVACRNFELTLLNKIHSIIAKARSRKVVMERMLELLGDFVGAKARAVFLVDHWKSQATLLESAGLPRRVKQRVSTVQLRGRTLGELVRLHHTFVMEEDVPDRLGTSEDIRVSMGIKRTVGFVCRTGTKRDYLVLLGLAEAKTIDPDIRAFFDTVARQFGIGLERVELLDAAERHGRELRELTGRLIDGAEDERRQCSRMLHDEVGQALTAIRLELETLERHLTPADSCVRKSLEGMRNQIRFVSEGTRSLSKSLHPSILDELGLSAAINWYIDNFVRREGLEVAFEEAGFDEDLPIASSLVLYRVAQEALTNAVRHSGASRVTISLTKGYPYAIMEVEDNGQGISAKRVKSKSKGLGLVSMRERVEHMGGEFHLISSPGKGTRIRVKIPIEVCDAKQGKGDSR